MCKPVDSPDYSTIYESSVCPVTGILVRLVQLQSSVNKKITIGSPVCLCTDNDSCPYQPYAVSSTRQTLFPEKPLL